MLTVLGTDGKTLGFIVGGTVQTDDPVLRSWFTLGVSVSRQVDRGEVERLVQPHESDFMLAVSAAAEARGWAIVTAG